MGRPEPLNRQHKFPAFLCRVNHKNNHSLTRPPNAPTAATDAADAIALETLTLAHTQRSLPTQQAAAGVSAPSAGVQAFTNVLNYCCRKTHRTKAQTRTFNASSSQLEAKNDTAFLGKVSRKVNDIDDWTKKDIDNPFLNSILDKAKAEITKPTEFVKRMREVRTRPNRNWD